MRQSIPAIKTGGGPGLCASSRQNLLQFRRDVLKAFGEHGKAERRFIGMLAGFCLAKASASAQFSLSCDKRTKCPIGAASSSGVQTWRITEDWLERNAKTLIRYQTCLAACQRVKKWIF